MTNTSQSTLWTIVNPNAGGGRAKKAFEPLMTHAAKIGVQILPQWTTAPGDATALARQAIESGITTIGVIGGDGTVYEVVQALMAFPKAQRPTLLPLPCGTGNSFLRDFGLARGIDALDQSLHMKRTEVDVVKVVTTEDVLYSLNIVGFGFSARAGALTNRKYKKWGVFGYVLAVIEATADIQTPTFDVTFNAEHFQDEVVLWSFCNSRCTGGGMLMAPGAQIDDGLIDVIKIGKLSRFGLLRAFPQIFSGAHISHPAVQNFQTDAISFAIESPIDVILDGEIVTRIPLSLSIERHAITIGYQYPPLPKS